MAHLYYGAETDPIEFPEDVLAHLKVVISTKLRRGESFTVSWQHSADDAPGRTTLWLQPSIPLRFVFSSSEPEALDSAILRRYADEANTAAGVRIDLSSWSDRRDSRIEEATAA